MSGAWVETTSELPSGALTVALVLAGQMDSVRKLVMLAVVDRRIMLLADSGSGIRQLALLHLAGLRMPGHE